MPHPNHPRFVLQEIADGGWSRVTPRMVCEAIEYIKGFGILHLTRDPDALTVWERLTSEDSTNGWAAIHPVDFSLFAMIVLDETEVH